MGTTTAELQAKYREAHERGDSYGYVQAYEAWVRAKCAAGERPDALRRDRGTATERFWAQVVESPDGHLYWDGPFREGRPVLPRATAAGSSRFAQRFAYGLRHGMPAGNMRVWAACGQDHCVNPDHLTAGHWAQMAQFSEDKLIGALQAAAIRLGHTPLISEYDALWERRPVSGGRGKMPSSATIQARLGSWTTGLRLAGLEPLPRQERRPHYSNEDILTALREYAREHGRPPSRGDWERLDRPPRRSVIHARFGPWLEALKAAGLR